MSSVSAKVPLTGEALSRARSVFPWFADESEPS